MRGRVFSREFKHEAQSWWARGGACGGGIAIWMFMRMRLPLPSIHVFFGISKIE